MGTVNSRYKAVKYDIVLRIQCILDGHNMAEFDHTTGDPNHVSWSSGLTFCGGNGRVIVRLNGSVFTLMTNLMTTLHST